MPRKRPRPEPNDPAHAAAKDAATTALRVAIELVEDGDTDAATRCAEYALEKAREATDDETLSYDDEADDGDEPPVALIASVALATLGSLAQGEVDQLEAGRAALEQSLGVWSGNAMARYRLAEMELHHGRWRRARELYEATVALPPAEGRGRPSWFAELVSTPRSEAVANASYMLALLLSLVGSGDDAVPHLRRLGVRHRLSPALWDAIRACPPPPAPPPSHASVAATAEVVRYSGAVPPALLQRLKAGFAPDAPFWRETSYLDRGYFSFWYDARKPPTNAVEELARVLLPLTGCADRVVGCEWWVHSKAASRSLGNRHGHQMHFDTEEGLLYCSAPEVAHPAVSSVLYLSDLSGATASAGPTVVLDQRYGADAAPARRAHVSHPADGHVLLFPGDRLHGVCPSAPPDAADGASATDGGGGGGNGNGGGRGGGDGSSKPQRGGRAPPLRGTDKLPRRVTLMIGFWTRDMAATLPRAPLRACGPMPRASRACTWPTTLAPDQPNGEIGESAAALRPTRHPVVEVTQPWEEVRPAAARGDDDAWAAAQLAIPEQRNNLYFVRGMHEFLFDHLDGSAASCSR